MTQPIAALFDFDGVVMDTETLYSVFWSKIGQKYYPDIPDFDRVIKGQTLKQIYDKYFPGMDEVREEIRRELACYEQEMAYEYISGAEGFISRLRGCGVKVAVVTSSSDNKMKHVYRSHPELLTLFDCIITSDLFTQSKPDPECFLLGAKMLGTVPENCFVFEDSFHGLEAGRRANMTVIGLCTTNSRAEIEDKSDFVISDFKEFSYDKMMNIKEA